MQRSRSVVSNSPVSIPSYALTKLRSFYKASEQVEEERFPGSREGLTGGQRARTFAHYIVILVLRVLCYRPDGISSLRRPGIPPSPPSRDRPTIEGKIEAKWRDTPGEKGSCVPAKNFPRLRKRGIKLDVARVVKKEERHKGNFPFVQLFSVLRGLVTPSSGLMRLLRRGYFINIPPLSLSLSHTLSLARARAFAHAHAHTTNRVYRNTGDKMHLRNYMRHLPQSRLVP